MTVVFETVRKYHKHIISRYLRNGDSVYIIEPFGAYHYKKVIRFYPPHLISHIEQLIREKKIFILKADQINAKEIYQMSADKAVEVIESVFPEYRKEHKELIEFVSVSLKSAEAEDVFKKSLCDRLAEFYSVNILLHRISRLFANEPVLMYPDINVRTYLYFKTLLSRCNQEIFGHGNVKFSNKSYKMGLLNNFKHSIIAISRLFAQTAASGLFSVFSFSTEKKKKEYSYGVSIISPGRQLSDNRRGPDFIIDNDKVRQHDVVYLLLTDLSNEQKKQLSAMPGNVYYPPKAGRCFSNFLQWAGLLKTVFKKNIFRNSSEVSTACNVFFNYFRWQKVLSDIKLRHFITHCDFGISHIGRNIALNQAGVQTWYFTDSMNHGCNWKTKEAEIDMRHPNWTYLNYDHFVTWDGLLAAYFNGHPGSIKNTHIVGCLWSGHIKDTGNTGEESRRNAREKFVLSVFDSTYSRNGITSYAEGIVFAEHVLRLANDCPDINIFIKEKKERDIHRVLDPVLGPRLLEIYREMGSHPGITVCSHGEDASALISASDMVISFPFTSTTFEALSVNKPAVWHDPLGYYRNTPYAEAGGVTTHSYEELKLKVLKIKSVEPGAYQNPVPIASPLMDPYRDGKAIDRFRELLCSQGKKVKQYTYSVCVTKNG